MRCYSCGVDYSESSARLKEMTFPDRLRTGVGYRVAASACTECQQLHLVLQEGDVEVDDTGEAHIRNVREPEILFPKVPTLRLESGRPDLAKHLAACEAIVRVSPLAAILLARTLLQYICRAELGIRRENLAQEIDDLAKTPYVNDTLKRALDALRRIANEAAHPAEGGLPVISEDAASLALTVVKVLVERCLEAPEREARLAEALETLLARLKEVSG
jgi:hypothetical protein